MAIAFKVSLPLWSETNPSVLLNFYFFPSPFHPFLLALENDFLLFGFPLKFFFSMMVLLHLPLHTRISDVTLVGRSFLLLRSFLFLLSIQGAIKAQPSFTKLLPLYHRWSCSLSILGLGSPSALHDFFFFLPPHFATLFSSKVANAGHFFCIDYRFRSLFFFFPFSPGVQVGVLPLTLITPVFPPPPRFRRPPRRGFLRLASSLLSLNCSGFFPSSSFFIHFPDSPLPGYVREQRFQFPVCDLLFPPFFPLTQFN